MRLSPHVPRALWLLVTLVVGAPGAFAQQAQVQVSESPYYVGVPIDIQVTAGGFERSPEPTIDAQVPPGTTLKLVDVSPSVSSRIEIINGHMTRSENVRFVYRYQLLADRPGRLEAGPFRVTQGATTALAHGVRFDIQQVPTTADQRFHLVLPQGPFWVGQRVTVTVEWWLTEAFAERLAGRRARVPLFDHVDRFKFEDEAVPKAKSTLVIDTASGAIELPVTVRHDQWQGKPYLVVSAQRTMIALKPGEVAIEPASIVTEEALRWSADFFGNRIPTNVRRLRVQDQEHTLVFKSPPAEGRPASFSGAVGKGFTIEASADRSVVQTGDPIRLRIDVRGDAALDGVSLPRLAVSGLDAHDFKIPEGPVAGIVEDGVKHFDVVLRVNNAQVSEIPPIALSWFNPDLGQYETTRSRPIAVSARAATVVSAADVVRPQAARDGNELGEGADAAAAAPAHATDAEAKPAFTLVGAELAIETRPDVLARDPVSWYERPAALGAMYLSGLAAVGLAMATRRRALLDPALRLRRRTLEAERRAVARARGVGDVARALRRMAAASPALPRDEYDALLLECDNLAFAPSAGDDTPIEAPLKTRALAVADAIIGSADRHKETG